MNDLPFPGDPRHPHHPLFNRQLGEALDFVRAALADCEQAGLSRDIAIAALAIELVPRLVSAYGPQQAAAALRQIADTTEKNESDGLSQ
jgi:hypothetical protein